MLGREGGGSARWRTSVQPLDLDVSSEAAYEDLSHFGHGAERCDVAELAVLPGVEINPFGTVFKSVLQRHGEEDVEECGGQA